MTIPGYVKEAVASPKRPARDVDRDAGRKPAETMLFFGVQPGQRVAELNAGWGYFTGVLSGVVGDTGQVYAHTTAASMERWKGNPVEKRIAKNGIRNIEPIVGTMDAPALPSGLDAVFSIMNYHDAVWTGADRSAMNAAVFTALRPGGVFGVIDHHATAGHGTDDCKTLHRIDRSVVVDEVARAGFVLEEESDLLANPDDPRTGGIHTPDIRDHTDRFMLRFRKPA